MLSIIQVSSNNKSIIILVMWTYCFWWLQYRDLLPVQCSVTELSCYITRAFRDISEHFVSASSYILVRLAQLLESCCSVSLSFNIRTLFLLVALYPKLGLDQYENGEYLYLQIAAK